MPLPQKPMTPGQPPQEAAAVPASGLPSLPPKRPQRVAPPEAPQRPIIAGEEPQQRAAQQPQRAPQAPPAAPPQRRRPPSAPPEEAPQPGEANYEVDAATGKRYKKVPGVTREAIAAHRKSPNGLSVEELLKYSQFDDDFNLDDLTGTAEVFLAHLRVPPSKEEQERLRQERAERIRRQTAQYRELHDEDTDQDSN